MGLTKKIWKFRKLPWKWSSAPQSGDASPVPMGMYLWKRLAVHTSLLSTWSDSQSAVIQREGQNGLFLKIIGPGSHVESKYRRIESSSARYCWERCESPEILGLIVKCTFNLDCIDGTLFSRVLVYHLGLNHCNGEFIDLSSDA